MSEWRRQETTFVRGKCIGGVMSDGGWREGQITADGLTSEILENEELLTAHGLEKP